MQNEFVFSSVTKDKIMAKLLRFIDKWPTDKPCKITVEPYKKRRSDQQNRYLWGMVYPTLIEGAGLEGWSTDDIHTYLLGEHFGWEELEGFGRKRMKPIKRSSKLSTSDFSDYIAFIQQFAAEHGVFIDDPDESMAA